MKVLLVDDNAVNQKLSKIMLESEGYEVEQAMDGKEALEKISQDNYDIIFMDLRMPVLNGFNATKKIRKNNSSVPIIALTLNDGIDMEEKCKKVGMNDFLEKPVRPENLLEMIKKWVK